ncbi:hypothetical protein F4604DRAFT_1683696 [Suillus subluteus]|nr:hypothetical protein F4604DRAFT_1683696 [Suillus subluteus]
MHDTSSLPPDAGTIGSFPPDAGTICTPPSRYEVTCSKLVLTPMLSLSPALPADVSMSTSALTLASAPAPSSLRPTDSFSPALAIVASTSASMSTSIGPPGPAPSQPSMPVPATGPTPVPASPVPCPPASGPTHTRKSLTGTSAKHIPKPARPKPYDHLQNSTTSKMKMTDDNTWGDQTKRQIQSNQSNTWLQNQPSAAQDLTMSNDTVQIQNTPS